MQNILWFQLLKCEDLMLFSSRFDVYIHCKANIFGSWSIGLQFEHAHLDSGKLHFTLFSDLIWTKRFTDSLEKVDKSVNKFIHEAKNQINCRHQTLILFDVQYPGGDSLWVYYEEKDDCYNQQRQIQHPQIVRTAHRAKCVNKNTKTLKPELALNNDTLKPTITSPPTWRQSYTLYLMTKAASETLRSAIIVKW